MEVKDFVSSMERTAFARAREVVGADSVPYPYAYGFFTSSVGATLEALNLTDEQKAVLTRYASAYADYAEKV